MEAFEQRAKEALIDKLSKIPGDWSLRVAKERGVSPRWVATRYVQERDEKTGEPIPELTKQTESAVDAKDLIQRVHRRNIALGIERASRREEVAQSA